MKNLTAQLYNGIAKRIWKTFDRIDAMPTRTIDELCAKEREIYKARKKFEAMPKRVQEAVGNIRKSDLV
jgi:hypothetical protein